jgi:transcriptional regulator with XRE-family HTH domain
VFVFSGDRLRAIRVAKDMSRESLAEQADSTYPAITSYERGYRSPPRATVLRLAAALGVHPSELVEPDPAFEAVSQ